MTYENALLIAAAFYTLLTAGATWLCVFIFDPLLPLRRDVKARRYLVIGFALLCFGVGYGIANAEIASGTLQAYYRPGVCDPEGDLTRCTPEVYNVWTERAAEEYDAFWHWLLIPPMTRPSCSTVNTSVCAITNDRLYGQPNAWYMVAMIRGMVMSITALLMGWMLTRPPKRQLTMEEEALLSLHESARRRETAKLREMQQTAKPLMRRVR